MNGQTPRAISSNVQVDLEYRMKWGRPRLETL